MRYSALMEDREAIIKRLVENSAEIITEEELRAEREQKQKSYSGQFKFESPRGR